MAKFTVATWNLDRCKTHARRQDAAELMAACDVDVWVLTETHDDVSPGGAYTSGARSAQRAGGRAGERWVAIWSRCSVLSAYGVRDDQFTAAVDVARPNGSITVFGTVLPWRGSTWQGYPSAGAVAYREALRVQQVDWTVLRQRTRELLVAGDFNQDLADTPYYWSRRARDHLEGALHDTQLQALTSGTRDPVRRLTGGAAACIDHVCATAGLAGRAAPAVARLSHWEGRQISDHPVVLVSLADA